VAAGYFVGGQRTKAAPGPNDRIRIAVVGTQNQASFSIDNVRNEEIVALCDVDQSYLDKRGQQFPHARRYRDFRKMLETEAPRIDAAIVATPDHLHAPATAMALRLGKHVYCEKPLTHTVHEARVIRDLTRQAKVATQMGTQIHAGDNYRRVVELVRSGAIGKVETVYTWCNKGWSDGRFAFGKPAPAHLDWDLWLGPATKRPYSENVHPANWRRFWDFGTGTLGDMGCHVIDLVQWALELGYPTSCRAEGPEVHPVGAPRWIASHLEFPARGSLPPVTLHWHDGGENAPLVKETRDEAGKPLSKYGLGILFVGDQGMLFADYGKRLLLPVEKFKDFAPTAPTIPPSLGHHKEWLHAIRTGSPTTCNFEYASRLTETVLLGTVAYRAGEQLAWDAERLCASNCSKADAYVRKEYRRGWEV
jgi:predicted dehydrogenase